MLILIVIEFQLRDAMMILRAPGIVLSLVNNADALRVEQIHREGKFTIFFVQPFLGIWFVLFGLGELGVEGTKSLEREYLVGWSFFAEKILNGVGPGLEMFRWHHCADNYIDRSDWWSNMRFMDERSYYLA